MNLGYTWGGVMSVALNRLSYGKESNETTCSSGTTEPPAHLGLPFWVQTSCCKGSGSSSECSGSGRPRP